MTAMAFDDASDEASHDASDDGPLTGIVAAMGEEVIGLRARLVEARPASAIGARLTLGRLGTARVALAVTGDGERNARRGLAGLLAAHPVSRIIVVGVAGGLSATLEVGTLVIGTQVINEVDGRLHGADQALVDAVAMACGARRGVAVTATRIADTVGEKRRLLALAAAAAPIAGDEGSSTASAVVDLESAAFAAAAARAGVRWVVLRAVSDTAADSVPALLNRSRDAGGAVRRGSVVRGLLTNPGALLPLLALRERVRTCADRLARAVELTMVALRARDSVAARSTSVTPDPRHAAAQRREKNLNGA
jgi:adenosylhomocysteine nucleosidase